MDIDNKQLERDIENAIRARGLKEQMQQWEAERKQTAEHPRIPTQEDSKPSKWRKLRRTIYSLSAVAVLVGILVMAVPASTWRTGYRQASRWAYKQYAHYFLPKTTAPAYEHTIEELMAMANPSVHQIECSYYEQEILGHENPMHEATWLILKGDYAVALSILDEIRLNLTEDNALYQTTKEDIEYLSALCYLGQNRRTKAKKMLITIAESDSHHREAASELVQAISEVNTHNN
jgi:hypothetical protein